MPDIELLNLWSGILFNTTAVGGNFILGHSLCHFSGRHPLPEDGPEPELSMNLCGRDRTRTYNLLINSQLL